MEYENGFYIYHPSAEGEQSMTELSIHQVIEIIEGEIWLTGISQRFDIHYAEAVGTIGKMVMKQDGTVL